MPIALIVEAASCWFMTGLIWLIQIEVYPSFRQVPASHFKDIHTRHSKKISRIVFPVMGIELLAAFGLYSSNSNRIYLINFLGVILIWILTGLVMVPIHKTLFEHGNSVKTVSSLVSKNWFRTILWSLRAVLLAVYIAKKSW